MAHGTTAPDRRGHAEVRQLVLDQLRAVHALKTGAMRMFSPMLASVRQQRKERELPSVDDLLGRMLEAFGDHCRETQRHEQLLRERLAELGGRPSRMRTTALRAAGSARAALGRLGGQNHGSNARDAFVFEHVEIASFELLGRLAERADDRRTAEVAHHCRAEDEQMAARIERNWSNVLNLMLAGEGIEGARRDPEDEEVLSQPQSATG
jgi:ferritin-like metal-binding protein YciE